jgi:hypothetical protein
MDDHDVRLLRAPDGTVSVPEPAPPGALRALLGMGSCYWAAGLVVAAVAFTAVAIPTAIIPNPIFGRQVVVRWWDPVVLAVSSVLIGMLWAARRSPAGSPVEPAEASARKRSLVGGALTFLAVGCPTCNKLVLVVLGTSGALSWFAPVQPILGVAAVVLLAVTLRRTLRTTGPLACAA